MKSELKIVEIIVLAEMSDGNVYNVLTKKETREVIISTIGLCENGIQLLETPIEGIEITTADKMKKERE